VRAAPHASPVTGGALAQAVKVRVTIIKASAAQRVMATSQ
jgi:hypothetical protein